MMSFEQDKTAATYINLGICMMDFLPTLIALNEDMSVVCRVACRRKGDELEQGDFAAREEERKRRWQFGSLSKYHLLGKATKRKITTRQSCPETVEVTEILDGSILFSLPLSLSSLASTSLKLAIADTFVMGPMPLSAVCCQTCPEACDHFLGALQNKCL